MNEESEYKKIIDSLDMDWCYGNLNSLNYEKLKNAPYQFIELLLSWHFDVFGLIEKGLAVNYNDINTLK